MKECGMVGHDQTDAKERLEACGLSVCHAGRSFPEAAINGKGHLTIQTSGYGEADLDEALPILHDLEETFELEFLGDRNFVVRFCQRTESEIAFGYPVPRTKPCIFGKAAVMASEQVSSSVSGSSAQVSPVQAWLARLGLSGKLLAAGGLVGVIAVFLPLITISIRTTGGNLVGGQSRVSVPAVSASQSVTVVRDWRGVLCLLGYIAALALAVVMYSSIGWGKQSLNWAGVGVGAFTTLLALWLLLGALSGSGGFLGLSVSVGIGAILNLLAAATVAAGGFLKVREEKLI
jgi:hypothetical protein